MNEKQSPEHEVSAIVRIFFCLGGRPRTCGWGLLRVVLARNYSIKSSMDKER